MHYLRYVCEVYLWTIALASCVVGFKYKKTLLALVLSSTDMAKAKRRNGYCFCSAWFAMNADSDGVIRIKYIVVNRVPYVLDRKVKLYGTPPVVDFLATVQFKKETVSKVFIYGNGFDLEEITTEFVRHFRLFLVPVMGVYICLVQCFL